MRYDPKAPFHERYVRNAPPVADELLDKVRDGVLRLNQALGYDFNTVEFAIRDGVPYAIDFCNPAPDADKFSIGEENFEWVVETAANMAVRKALAHQPGRDNLTWGEFVIAASGHAAAAAAGPGPSQPAAPEPAPMPEPAPPAAAGADDAQAAALAEHPAAPSPPLAERWLDDSKR